MPPLPPETVPLLLSVPIVEELTIPVTPPLIVVPSGLFSEGIGVLLLRPILPGVALAWPAANAEAMAMARTVNRPGVRDDGCLDECMRCLLRQAFEPAPQHLQLRAVEGLGQQRLG